jgi:hypothetical protein
MSKKEQIRDFSNFIKKVNAFLFSKNVFIFLFFLIISYVFWFIISLNKNYETRLTFPLEYRNIPKEIALSTDLPSSIDVKVKDKGTVIFTYKQSKFSALVIDFKDIPGFSKNKSAVLSTSDTFDKKIKEQLAQTTVITDYFPSEITIERIFLSSKKLPIRINCDIRFAKQYNLSDSIKANPDSIILYGTEECLDTTVYISTNLLRIKDIKDTLNRSVGLLLPKHTKADNSKVNLMIPVEVSTEASIMIPVKVINTPKNIRVRVLPGEVKLTYMVGISKYKKVKSSDFTVSIDYEDLIESSSKTEFVNIDTKPSFVSNCRINPQEVQWVMEVIED